MIRVTSQNVLSVGAAYACVKFQGEQVASLPLRFYDTRNGGRVRITEHPALDALMDPNPFQSYFDFVEMMTHHLLLRGAAYAQIIRDNRQRPRQLWPLHPDATRPVLDKANRRILYAVTDANGEETVLGPDEVLHIRGLHSDLLTPISPVEQARRTLELEWSLHEHSRSSFGENGARPGGIIKNSENVDPDTVLRYVARFNKRNAGPSNSGKVLYLPKGLEWEQIQLTNNDQQFIQTRVQSFKAVCRVFGVPASLLGEQSESKYATVEADALHYVQFALRPLLSRVELQMAKQLLGHNERRWIEIDFDASVLLRGDNKSQAEYLRTLVQGSVATPNEARERTGLSRIDDPAADRLWFQMNMVPLGQEAEFSQPRRGGGDGGGSPPNPSNSLPDAADEVGAAAIIHLFKEKDVSHVQGA